MYQSVKYEKYLRMDKQTLKRYVGNPKVHRQALAGHAGRYSLGVGRDAKHRGAMPVLTLDTNLAEHHPELINIDGEPVLLMVKTDLGQPQPF